MENNRREPPTKPVECSVCHYACQFYSWVNKCWWCTVCDAPDVTRAVALKLGALPTSGIKHNATDMRSLPSFQSEFPVLCSRCGVGGENLADFHRTGSFCPGGNYLTERLDELILENRKRNIDKLWERGTAPK